MTKYRVDFTMDGINSTYTVHVIIESKCDLNTTTSELVRAVHSAEFFTADRNPEYYTAQKPGRAVIRTSKIIEIIVKEA